MKFETVSTFKNISNPLFKQLTDEEIKRLQSVLLDILKDFDRICKKHSIHYVLGGGTALGAVRNKGFIPWDDDIDINISRDNYQKLLNVYLDELKNEYWLHTPDTHPELGIGFARLRKKGTVLKSREDNFNNECGAFIDLFVIENTFDNHVLYFFHGLASYFTGFLLSCRNFYKNRILYLALNPRSVVFKAKIIVGFLLSVLPVSFYSSLWNDANKMCSNNDSKRVTIPVGRNHFFKETYPRTDIIDSIEIPFETITCPISKQFDKYLKKLYGDYRAIPEKKEAHIVLDFKL